MEVCISYRHSQDRPVGCTRHEILITGSETRDAHLAYSNANLPRSGMSRTRWVWELWKVLPILMGFVVKFILADIRVIKALTCLSNALRSSSLAETRLPAVVCKQPWSSQDSIYPQALGQLRRWYRLISPKMPDLNTFFMLKMYLT